MRGAAAWSAWWRRRLPEGWVRELLDYPTPANLNLWSVFGSLALLLLALQLITGILLTMHYQPSVALAFDAVETLMRDQPWGWLLRDLHAAGASALFAVIALHVWRALLYGSHRAPRELVWLLGCALLLALMAEAFVGYLLPWGQMSYWGAQVILNLIDAVPGLGPGLALWMRGGYTLGDATLGRFFALHVAALPLLLLGLAALHVVALHRVGSGNPTGVDRSDQPTPTDAPPSLPFHPRVTAHDLVAASLLALGLAAVVLLAPTLGGLVLEPVNFVPADPLQTPEHIAPVWYFTPFYAVLRATTDAALQVWLVVLGVATLRGLVALRHRPRAAVALLLAAAALGDALWTVDAKLWGIALMASLLRTLVALPWLDRAPQRALRRRPRWHRALLLAVAAGLVTLGVCGALPLTPARNRLALLATLVVLVGLWTMPWWSRRGRMRAARSVG